MISDDRASEEIHADWLDEVLSFPSFRVTDDRASEVHAVWPDDISAHFWLVSNTDDRASASSCCLARLSIIFLLESNPFYRQASNLIVYMLYIYIFHYKRMFMKL